MKEWYYTKGDEAYTIEYHGDYFLKEDNVRIPVNELWEATHCTTNLDVDYNLFQFLINETEHPINPWYKEFYTAFDFRHFKSNKFFFNQPEQEIELHLTTYGLFERKYGTIGPHRFNPQALHKFFFHGPITYGIPLQTRRTIRQDIWNALNHSIVSFKQKDAFPLLDYNAIPYEAWEKPMVDVDHKLSLHPERGRLELHRLYNINQKSTTYLSFESVYHNPNLLGAHFKDKSQLIHTMLERAIIP